jgi:hypothetical protein
MTPPLGVRWTIKVSQEVDRNLRAYLAEHGSRKGDLSRFVEEAVEERLYRLMLDAVQERNADLGEADAAALVDGALRWSRADR